MDTGRSNGASNGRKRDAIFNSPREAKFAAADRPRCSPSRRTRIIAHPASGSVAAVGGQGSRFVDVEPKVLRVRRFAAVMILVNKDGKGRGLEIRPVGQAGDAKIKIAAGVDRLDRRRAGA